MNHEIPRGLSPTITWPPRQWYNGPTDDIPADGRRFSQRFTFNARSLANFPRGNFEAMIFYNGFGNNDIYREIK